MARLEESASVELATLKYYTAKHGDTLATIARKLSVSKVDLADANYLPSSARVSAGQKLMVPHEAAVLHGRARRTRRARQLRRGRPLRDAGRAGRGQLHGPRQDVVSGQARRHVGVDCSGVPDLRRLNQDLEPAHLRRSSDDRSAADRLSPGELAYTGGDEPPGSSPAHPSPRWHSRDGARRLEPASAEQSSNQDYPRNHRHRHGCIDGRRAAPRASVRDSGFRQRPRDAHRRPRPLRARGSQHRASHLDRREAWLRAADDAG